MIDVFDTWWSLFMICYFVIFMNWFWKCITTYNILLLRIIKYYFHLRNVFSINTIETSQEKIFKKNLINGYYSRILIWMKNLFFSIPENSLKLIEFVKAKKNLTCQFIFLNISTFICIHLIEFIEFVTNILWHFKKNLSITSENDKNV